MSWMLVSINEWTHQLVSFAFFTFLLRVQTQMPDTVFREFTIFRPHVYWATKKPIELFLEGQNRFFTKEMWVRPMSSSSTSTSGQSVSCMGRYEVDSIHTSFYRPAIMECRLCLWALAQLIKPYNMPGTYFLIGNLCCYVSKYNCSIGP